MNPGFLVIGGAVIGFLVGLFGVVPLLASYTAPFFEAAQQFPNPGFNVPFLKLVYFAFVLGCPACVGGWLGWKLSSG